MAVSPVAVFLEANKATGKGDFERLKALARDNSQVLTLRVILRLLLTSTPEGTHPSEYVGFLRDIADKNLSVLDDLPALNLEQEELGDESLQKLQQIKLQPLPGVSEDADFKATFTAYLLEQARKIERENGSTNLVEELLDPFKDDFAAISRWLETVFYPFQRIEGQFYPGSPAGSLTLDAFEKLQGPDEVASFLRTLADRSRSSSGDLNLQRDVEWLISPWLEGQLQDENGPSKSSKKGAARSLVMDAFCSWLLELAETDLRAVASVFESWDGPAASRREKKLIQATEQYRQAAVAVIYVPNLGANLPMAERLNLCFNILSTFPEVKSGDFEQFTPKIGDAFLDSVSKELLSKSLLGSNPLTSSKEAVPLAHAVLHSARLLDKLGEPTQPNNVLQLVAYSIEADQRAFLQKVLRHFEGKKQNDDKWAHCYRMLLWLWRWNSPEQKSGVFSKVQKQELEERFLKVLLASGNFAMVDQLYKRLETALEAEAIDRVILDSAYRAFDNASNGNKTRGGVKKANELITHFGPSSTIPDKFQEAASLIAAAHSLSFYSLTLQHGVPFVPVSIRTSENPMVIIEKVLAQNPRGYTKLDDLLDIGSNFVKAGLFRKVFTGDYEQDHLIQKVRQEIIAKAIDQSLEEEDFDTAYSYVVSRLTQPGSAQPDDDDILWKAAYRAGSHQPAGKPGKAIHRLEQRKDLLSQALQIAPASALQQILKTWQACEEELNQAVAHDVEEEEKWNRMGDQSLPGAFTHDVLPHAQPSRMGRSRANDEEAPMGLFDVARGAAAAFQRTAFAPGQRPEHHEVDEEDDQRTRKRDVVSSMVTSGLTSGIGWVLGANPVNKE